MDETRKEIDSTISEFQQEHGLLTPKGLPVGAMGIVRVAVEREISSKMRSTEHYLAKFGQKVENTVHQHPLWVAAAVLLGGALLNFSKASLVSQDPSRLNERMEDYAHTR